MMKKFLVASVMTAVLCMGSHVYGQSKQQVYLGLGMGLDHGGLGVKAEYLPIKYFGIFGGVGYNFLSAGWNAGATCKILPNKRVSPNLMVFYGYNGVTKAIGAPEYNMTSYGVTVGANLDIFLGISGNKLSFGLFVPIRSSEFMNNYDAMRNDPKIEMISNLLPIAFSAGFNFALIQ